MVLEDSLGINTELEAYMATLVDSYEAEIDSSQTRLVMWAREGAAADSVDFGGLAARWSKTA